MFLCEKNGCHPRTCDRGILEMFAPSSGRCEKCGEIADCFDCHGELDPSGQMIPERCLGFAMLIWPGEKGYLANARLMTLIVGGDISELDAELARITALIEAGLEAEAEFDATDPTKSPARLDT